LNPTFSSKILLRPNFTPFNLTMRHSLFTIILSADLARSQATWNVGQSVKTTSGNVVGQPSSWKNQVSEYLGIPFAQAPSGDLRWAPPAAIKDDSKTINATKYVRSILPLRLHWLTFLLGLVKLNNIAFEV
jgi:hypothetical protein